MDFSVIQNDPTIRALVQDNALIRSMLDGLYPRNLFRGEAAPVLQPGQAGDQFIFTGNGLMAPVTNPLDPSSGDPTPQDYEKEQWNMQLHQYANRMPDTHMPTSIVAIANLFTNNVHQLGLNAAQSLNRVVRDKLYNAGMSGWTVASANAGAGTSIPVQRLNGFTTARRPDLANGSPVQFARVSTSNPLQCTLLHSAVNVPVTVVDFTPTYSGDETGPGTLTVLETVTVTARDAIWSSDSTYILRAGGGQSIDALSGTDNFSFDLFRSAVGRLEDSNVPKMPDGFYHSHFNSYSKNQLMSSDEAQRLQTSLPDYYWFKEFTLGDILGTLVFNDTETPKKATVRGGLTNTYDGNPRTGERFGGELQTTAGVEVQRPIFIGAEAIYEYYADLRGLITEAGVNGQVGDFSQLTNNGVEVNADRVQVYLRAPVNVMGDIVTGVWKTIMDWPTRTDSATGDASRMKRVVVVEHI